MPDIAFSNIINYKTQSASLSSFKGRLLILDFWATWCTSCLRHFPQLDSLPQQYNTEVQVLLVNATNTGDDEKKIQAFFEKRKAPNGKRYALPTVIYDTILTRLFPHKLIPHYIWLDSSRKVVAITSAEELTAANIKAFLGGSLDNLPLKKDALDFNRHLPLLVNGNGGGEAALLFRSLLTTYLEGLPSGGGSSLTEDSARMRIWYTNRSILALYQSALGRAINNRLVLEVPNPASLLKPSANKAEWIKQHTFCYELTLPSSASPQRVSTFFLNDLNTHFGYYGRMEKRLAYCYVVVKTKKPSIVPGGSTITLSQLVKAFNTRLPDGPLKPILLNETNEEINLSPGLLSSASDLRALGQALQPYGLALVPVQRELEVFVLTENSTKEQPENTATAPTKAQTKTSSNQPKNKTQY